MKKKNRPESLSSRSASRRRFLAGLPALGMAPVAFSEPLLRQVEEEGDISLEDIKAAEKLAGLEYTDEERSLMLKGVRETVAEYQKIRSLEIENGVSPALSFETVPVGPAPEPDPTGSNQPRPGVARPLDTNELAFMPVHKLADLIRTRRISSAELTDTYLKRLKRGNDVLECVISFVEERAHEAARKADAEIAAGACRGPLHGIPWGAKDLLSVAGYKTTWGAMPYKDQVIEEDATAVKRLDEAGAVLVAKLTLGALAWGDVWFGGKTKNPWNLEQGSSGSSAGSASATAAGLVGFAIGSETWGSIVSPSTVCGTTGLRPTFGRVARTGAMALSWSMDKLGPIARSVEDCAYIFEAIQGADGIDLSTVDRPFTWKRHIDPSKIRIGYLKPDFEAEREEQEEWKQFDIRTLNTLESMGFELVPIELPDFPISSLSFILSVEAAAAFDELTLSGRDDLLVRQIENAWPNSFRQARMIPAVEYVQANRARTILMHKIEEVIKDVDLYMSPSWVGDNLLMTNLTGHPCVVLPNGFRSADGTPTSITFNGHLHGEEILLAVANAYQEATDFHLKHPDLVAARRRLKKNKEEGDTENK